MTKKSLLLPQAMRTARENHEWTQMELAERLGVSQSTISFWERGIETPSLENQIGLVTLLPEILEQQAEQEANILARLYRLERAIYGDKCRCQGCGCGA